MTWQRSETHCLMQPFQALRGRHVKIFCEESWHAAWLSSVNIREQHDIRHLWFSSLGRSLQRRTLIGWFAHMTCRALRPNHHGMQHTFWTVYWCCRHRVTYLSGAEACRLVWRNWSCELQIVLERIDRTSICGHRTYGDHLADLEDKSLLTAGLAVSC